MKWRVVEDKNIADLYLTVFGKDKKTLLKNIVLAFADQITDLKKIQENIKEKIVINQKNFEKIVFELINRLIYLKDVKETIFKKSQFCLKKNYLETILIGQKISDNLPLKIDIKALTYHKFKIEKKKKLLVAHLVFDI